MPPAQLRRPGSVSAESKDWPIKESRVDQVTSQQSYGHALVKEQGFDEKPAHNRRAAEALSVLEIMAWHFVTVARDLR